MSIIKCPISDCNFKVYDETLDDCKAIILQLHLNVHQSALKSATTKPARIEQPKLLKESSTEDWSFFLSRWATYKSATKLTGDDINIQLTNCCEENLQKDLHRVYNDTTKTMNEENLLQAIKKLAVIDENALVSRYKLHNLKQNVDEPITSYAARIKGQANVCGFFEVCPKCKFTEVNFSHQIIRDVITKGIADEDIRLSLLGEKNQNLSLEETIAYIQAKENGKQSASRLIDDITTISAATTSRYKKMQ